MTETNGQAVNLPAVPTTADEAVAAIHALVGILGQGFHPDTRGEDYVNGDGTATFTDEQAERYDEILDAVFDLDEVDPYAVAVEALGIGG